MACLLATLGACTAVKNEPSEVDSSSSAADGGAAPESDASTDAAGAAGRGTSVGRVSVAGRTAAGSGGAGNAAPSGGAGAGSTAGTGETSSPTAGTPAGPAGAPAPVTGEVTGKVIDFWRQPMEAVQVTIGSTTVTTDAAGAFRIPDVAATYDATLLISTTQNAQPRRMIWRYEGLRRRDPTLQAYVGNTPRGAWLDVRIMGVDFAKRPAGDVVLSSYGGVTGESAAEPSTAAQERIRIVWEGPRTTRFTGHAFRMLKLPDRMIEPYAYYAYHSVTFDISEDAEVRVEYNLPQGMLPFGTVNGTLEGPAGNERSVSMYMRFPDHAIIQLMTDRGGSPTFSYGIPSMPSDAKVILVAAQLGEGFQMMHVDDIDKDTGQVALILPSSPRSIAPADRAMVDTGTTFQWESEPNVFVFVADDETGRDTVQVVTTNREARLPLAPTYAYQANHNWKWRIETHGSYASVDQVTGPEGYLDTLALYYRPDGPTRGKGTFAESVERRVSIKP